MRFLRTTVLSLAVASLADHVQVVFQFEDLAHAVAHHRVIVDQQDTVEGEGVHEAVPCREWPRNSGWKRNCTRVPWGLQCP